VLSKPIITASILLIFSSLFSSYYTTYAFFVNAEPSGKVGCERTGTLKVKCCQYHIINKSPSNPAGSLVNYCTDCDVGPGGVPQNCGERYIDSVITGLEDPKPEKDTPFKEHIPPGVIEKAEPIIEGNPNNPGEKVQPQQGFTGQLSSETLEGNNDLSNSYDAQSAENNIENEDNN
jgi:hypothetical protein